MKDVKGNGENKPQRQVDLQQAPTLTNFQILDLHVKGL